MNRQSLFHSLPLSILALCLTVLCSCHGKSRKGGDADTLPLQPAPVFVADTAMAYVRAQCSFGPRVPDSEAHQLCGAWIANQFRSLGATVTEQTTRLRGYDGNDMGCCNIIARLNPEATDRVVFTAHWDSRAWADHDPDEAHHHTPVLAANDGASGVAVMLEMARAIQTQPLDFGVDFVCFDLEDQGPPDWAEDDGNDANGYWCLGSNYWAAEAYAQGYRARYAVNLDMVGGRGASFAMEGFSQQYAMPLVNMIWHVAEQLGYGSIFIQKSGGYVTDDHVPVNRVARIPAIDIVPSVEHGPSSFGPTWHTTDDTPENIDPQVMKAVGQTLLQVLYNDGH